MDRCKIHLSTIFFYETDLAFGLVLVAVRSSGALLITEFLPDPTGTDIDREWFEIYNSGDLPIDLTGYAAGDGTNPTNTSAGEGMGVFPAGTVINARQVFVIAANANGFAAFYGFLPNLEFFNSTSTLGNNPDVPDMMQKDGWGAAGGSLGIANGGDDVGILTPESTPLTFTFLDGSNHGNVQSFFGGAPTLTSNQSYERVPANMDSDTASEWVVRTSNNATPGLVTIPEPTAAALMLIVAPLAAMHRRVKSGALA